MQYRHERFESSVYAASSSTPYFEGGSPYDRDVTAAFAELQIPLIGAANAVPGVQRLTLSLAGRVEHYDDVGTTANPKIGLVWAPIQDVKVHATYGTSFRAPSLPEVHQPTSYEPTPLSSNGETVLTLVESGGDPNLKPQTASTWTAGIDWSPHQLRGLKLGADWYSIDFKNEISTPGINIFEAGLDAPAYQSLITHLNPDNPSDLALINALLAKAPAGTASLYPAAAYAAVVDDRYVNASELTVQGVDFNAGYSFCARPERLQRVWYRELALRLQPAGHGRLAKSAIGVNAGLPCRLSRAASPAYGLGDRILSAATLNYAGRYKDPTSDRPDRCLDHAGPLHHLVAGESDTALLTGLVATLAVQNLLDQDPPFYDSPNGVGYDPANANPLGRGGLPAVVEALVKGPRHAVFSLHGARSRRFALPSRPRFRRHRPCAAARR